MFREYVSNIAAGTGTNYIIETGEVKTYRVRAYMKPLLAGDFNWAFSYVNAVNSTFAKGDVAWCNKEGGNFRINYAFIADGGEIGGLDVTPTEDFVRIPVTFGGEASRDVMPGEVFRSDPVRIALPENHYLLFEWELTGDGIPGTPDSQSAAFIEKDGVWKPANTAPLPALFGCDRPFKKRVAFIGDSITQGCQTRPNAYEMWAGRIAAMLQPEYAVWNLGLGYARASDAATDGCWLAKAKQADVVIMTLGVNDIFHGALGSERGSTAGEIIASLERIITLLQEAGVTVILSTVPPFSFPQDRYLEWRAVNLAIPAIAAMHGCRVYDIESALDESASLGNKFTHGAHPDGEGGRIAAEKFYHTFHTDAGWTI